MHGFAGMRKLAVWYTHLEMAEVVRPIGTSSTPLAIARAQTHLVKAHTHDSLEALAKLTTQVDGRVGSSAIRR